MKVALTKLKNNPKNPRVIRDEKFNKLKKSIEDFPDMLEKRPLVVFTDKDGKFVVLGGNMRLKAAKELGIKELPVIVADEWTEEQKAQFLIKDNVNFGEWNHEELANEWDAIQLQEWGLEVFGWEDDLSNNEEYNGLDAVSKLDKFMSAELKRMFLVYDNETFEKVTAWFSRLRENYILEDNSSVILKLMENENI
jgi:hypothetical protein